MEDITARVTLRKIIDEMKLTDVVMPDSPDELTVGTKEIQRPGLALTGFYEHFDPKRIQIIGSAESCYLDSLDPDEKREKLLAFLKRSPVAIIFTHARRPDDVMLDLAEYFSVPILTTDENTSTFMAALIAFLNVRLAPQITRHGVLVEVYGEGILILGDSGVGKSETAIELIKYYIELRGIGIVDVRRLFGMGSVKETEKIDLIIKLEPWEKGKEYDRFGLVTEYTNILGIDIPSTVIPVQPGRNLAVVIEIAAMNNRQKKMGYNTAEEFDKKLSALGGE